LYTDATIKDSKFSAQISDVTIPVCDAILMTSCTLRLEFAGEQEEDEIASLAKGNVAGPDGGADAWSRGERGRRGFGDVSREEFDDCGR
jgi:hypothetical protein